MANTSEFRVWRVLQGDALEVETHLGFRVRGTPLQIVCAATMSTIPPRLILESARSLHEGGQGPHRELRKVGVPPTDVRAGALRHKLVQPGSSRGALCRLEH